MNPGGDGIGGTAQGCYDRSGRLYAVGRVVKFSDGKVRECRPGNFWQNIADNPAEGCFDGNGRFHSVGKIFKLSNGKRMICQPGDRWDYL